MNNSPLELSFTNGVGPIAFPVQPVAPIPNVFEVPDSPELSKIELMRLIVEHYGPVRIMTSAHVMANRIFYNAVTGAFIVNGAWFRTCFPTFDEQFLKDVGVALLEHR